MPFKVNHDLLKTVNTEKNIKLFSNGNLAHWNTEGKLNAIYQHVVSMLWAYELNPKKPDQHEFLKQIIDIGLTPKEIEELKKAASRMSLPVLNDVPALFGLSYLEVLPDRILINIAVEPGQDQLAKCKAALQEYRQKISSPEQLADRPVKVKGLDPHHPNQEVLNLLRNLPEKSAPKNDEKSQQPHLSQKTESEEGKQKSENKSSPLAPPIPPKPSRQRSVYDSSNPPRPGEGPTTTNSPAKKGKLGS